MDFNLDSIERERNAALRSKNLTQQEIAGINAEYDAKRKEILTANFEAEKKAAIIEATIKGAVAVISAFKDSIPAGFLMAALVGVQILNIAAQPTPKFHTGGVDINPNKKNRKGEFDAKLIEGESVIHAKATKQWTNELKAMNDMKFEDYVISKYVVPALRAQQEEVMKHQNNSLASNMANSIMMNQSKFNDANITQWLKVVNNTSKENTKVLSKALGNKRTYARG